MPHAVAELEVAELEVLAALPPASGELGQVGENLELADHRRAVAAGPRPSSPTSTRSARTSSSPIAAALSRSGERVAGVDLVADVDPQLEGEARGELGAGGAR